MTITVGMENSPISNQLSIDVGPAISAAIAGNARIPEPNTAPIVRAEPLNQMVKLKVH